MNSSNPNDFLPPVLATWRVTPPVNPRFRSEVWARLQSQTRESYATYVRSHLTGWTMVAALLVVTAVWTGHAVGEAKLNAKRDAMVVSYLVDLDPRVQAKIRP